MSGFFKKWGFGLLEGSIFGLIVLTWMGCHTPSSPASVQRQTDAGQSNIVRTSVLAGEVLHVNKKYQYVILKCAVLPSGEEEAKVYRGNQVVARLRLSGPVYVPFVAADIIDGAPQTGDKIKP